MDKFTEGYVECLLWSSHDGDDDKSLLYRSDVTGIADEAFEQIEKDCMAFQEENAALLEGIDPEQCGYDFWLTRNGHGTGFWDRGLGEVGQRLTEACKAYGSCDPYVGDDKQVYI